MNKKIIDQINQISLDLRLAAFRNDIKDIITQAVEQTASYEQVILDLLKAEQQIRLINRKKVQMRNAAFPQLKYLQDINRQDLPADAIAKLPCYLCGASPYKHYEYSNSVLKPSILKRLTYLC